MLKLRFNKRGKKNYPIYQIVIIMNTKKQNGKACCKIGFYNPLTKNFKINLSKLIPYLQKGIQITKTLKALLLKINILY